jgi:hypothetical protein
MLVDKGAYGLHAWPAGQRLAEQGPGEIFECAIHLTVAAGKQKLQDVVRQILHVVLGSIPDLRVGLSSIFDDRIVTQHHTPGWDEEAVAAISKGIDERRNRNVRLHLQTLGLSDRRCPRGMQGKHQHYRSRLWKMKRHVVADSDQHNRCTISLIPKNLPLSFEPHYMRESQVA